ncbi:MAG: ATPase [Alphaproteobacteria bacterium]|nr:ATPase [Alphaproteobacteria bacterium]
MKRFYDVASTARQGDAFSLLLDGKVMRTPAKNAFSLPTQSLAEAIAEEWTAQSDTIDAAAMPLTRHAYTAIDGVSANIPQVADEVARFGATDLLCYRAESPPVLVQRQSDAWQPLLNWLQETYGVALTVTAGVVPVGQDDNGLVALRKVVGVFSAFELTGLHTVVSVSGSLVIGLAVAAEKLDPAAAWAVSRIDNDFQADQWGVDPEAAADAARAKSDLVAAARLMGLVRAE